jgi:hypothetical protein
MNTSHEVGHCPTYKICSSNQSSDTASKLFNKTKLVKENTSLIVLRIFKCSFITLGNFSCFFRNKTFFSCFFQNGEHLRQNSPANQPIRGLPLLGAYLTNILQIVPEMYYYYVPVNYNFTSACQLNCIYKLILQSVVVLL